MTRKGPDAVQMPARQRDDVRPRWHLSSLTFIAALVLFAAFSIAWLSGNAAIASWADWAHQAQLAPPWFAAVPDEPQHGWITLGFAIATVVVLSGLGLIAPSTRWARAFMAGIVVVLVLRYLLWRFFASLNFATPADGVFSLALLFLEVPLVLAGLPGLFWIDRPRDRSQAADRYETTVKAGEYLPEVDVFIPTYNEPERIVRRTIVGCQALDYPRKTIYILDDGKREAIAALARELGCEYMVRGDRRHAKAGNLNHALQHTRGELIAIFDADFVPTRPFLQRAIGFFQRPDVGLVQTHQIYYNPDPIVRNLGLAKYLTTQREEFSRHSQPIGDGVGATICDGSGFVVRRASLEAVGGFVTESITEDYFTGIMLDAQQQRVIYLNENLSAGLAAENINDYMSQYKRWQNGNLQALAIRANPLMLPGLRWEQRLYNFAGLIFWLGSLRRPLLFIAPILWTLARISPIGVDPQEGFYFLFLPSFILLFARSWLSQFSASIALAEVYETVHAIPFSITAIQSLIAPFHRGFQVTPKGFLSTDTRFNTWLTLPLALLWVANVATFAIFLWQIAPQGFGSVLTQAEGTIAYSIWIFWWLHNIVFLGLAIVACVDAARSETYEWLRFERPILLRQGDRQFPSTSTLASESGLRVRLDRAVMDALDPQLPLTVEIQPGEWPGDLSLSARALSPSSDQEHCPVGRQGAMAEIELDFEGVTTAQYRHLVELLFCRPGQWPKRRHPGELGTLALLCRSVLQPRFTRPDEPANDAVPIR